MIIVLRSAIIALFLFAGSTFLAAQVTNEPDYHSFAGRIKSVEEHSFRAKSRFGKNVKGRPRREYNWQRDYLIGYDSNGVKREKFIYVRGKVISRHISYQYDAHGFLVKEIVRNARHRIVDSTSYVNTYNDSGQLVKRIVRRSSDKSAAEFRYQYDISGIQESFLRTGSNPEQLQPTRKFDRNWRTIAWWTYTETGKPMVRHAYVYDTNGQISVDSIFLPWTHLIMVRKWKYAPDGLLMRKEVCSAGRSNCESWTFKYTYDSKGNWTRAVEYRNGQPVFIKERTLTYFE